MSFIGRWFWSEKKVEESEEEKMRKVHQAIFKEMKDVFEECELASYAERKYDYDDVFDLLTRKMHAVDKCYTNAKFIVGAGGCWVFESEEKRMECFAAAESYLDCAVENIPFIRDYVTMLRVPLAKRIFAFAEDENFFFGGQYWHLFRRSLNDDLGNKKQALEEIEAGNEAFSKGIFVDTSKHDEKDEENESWGE